MVCQWFDNNKLSLNLQKTKFISFQFQFIHQHEIKIMIDNVEIKKSL